MKPYIQQEAKDRICQVLDSGYLTEGPVTWELEEKFEQYIGCKHALAACNCTVGLEMALRALNIGPDDEVIVPDYTYPATASVVQIVGARIVIVDIDRKSMLIDYEALEKAITSRTKAIIPVSIFGNPLNYNQLRRIKYEYNINIVEDAACSVGAKYDDKFVGNLADISVFSLHPRKFITTGEGGIVTTNNTNWYDWMKSYKHFGLSRNNSRQEAHFDRIGTNYKLSDIQAALGLVQMQQIDSLLSQRVRLAQYYLELLNHNPKLSLPMVTTKGIHSRQSFCIFIENRNEVIRKLRKKGIETQIGTYSLHMHKAFSQNHNCIIKGDMNASRYAFNHCLTLPLFHDMTEKEQEFVVSELLRCMA